MSTSTTNRMRGPLISQETSLSGKSGGEFATRMRRLFVLFVAIGIYGNPTQAADMHALNLTDHEPNAKIQLTTRESGVFTWTLPDGLSQTLTFDLAKIGLTPSQFDEFRFDIMPVDGPVLMHARTAGIVAEGRVSSWYSKFPQPTGQWTQGRFDLRLDDDGCYAWAHKGVRADQFTLSLIRRTFGKTGERKLRQVLIRNPRFVKRGIDAVFEVADVAYAFDGESVAYTYPLQITNRSNAPCTVHIEPDSEGTLHFFDVDKPAPLNLAANANLLVPLKVSIPYTKALSLPTLYSERLLPRVWVDGQPKDDTYPLLGYRPNHMWAVVPAFNDSSWTPERMQAFLAPRKQLYPSIASWDQSVLRRAKDGLDDVWPIPNDLLPMHGSALRCPTCKKKLHYHHGKPLSIRKHRCAHCEINISGVEKIDRAAVQYNYNFMGGSVRRQALAWLLSGEDAHAKKAVSLLLQLADAYERLPCFDAGSTSGATRLGYNSLLSSYILPSLAEGFYFLAAYPGFTKPQRDKVRRFLIVEAAAVARHCVEYTNMSSEAMRACGSVGIATGHWPLAGKAIYGDYGYHELIDKGFSEDGIAHEGGAYHRAAFGASNEFAYFAHLNGINLYTAGFKRVFDGSAIAGKEFATTSYETAYRQYRDPLYLPLLAKRNDEHFALTGVLGIPDAATTGLASTVMKGAGYVYLRQGTPTDNREIRLNYIKFFDRDEMDRFSTFFFRNQKRIDGGIGRMPYGNRNAKFMYATAAHNAVVINGGDQRDTTGTLLAFNSDPQHPAAVVVTDKQVPFYAGVQQLRAIALVDGFYVVFDRLTAAQPVTIDRYQYGLKKASMNGELAMVAADFPHVPQQQYGAITNIKGRAAGKELGVRFENGMQMALIADRNFDIYHGQSYGGEWYGDTDVTFARIANSTEAAFLAAFTDDTGTVLPTLSIVKNTATEVLLALTTTTKTYHLAIDVAGSAISISEATP